jgi:hypothetical protein
MYRPEEVRRALAIAGVLLVTLAIAIPASAAQGTGSVTVQATNNAAITIAVSDGTADFGTNIDPLGTDSNSSDVNQVVDFQDASGSYYVWRSNGGNGLTITVKSNKSWTGSVVATENTGTSKSMTVESGVLRFRPTIPANYYDAALSQPFTLTSLSFEAAGTKGVHSYSHYYALRVSWADDPGTFVSSVAYSATH